MKREDAGSMKIAEKYGLLIDEIPNDYSNPVENLSERNFYQAREK
jgi:hypothetical protein